MGMLSVHFSAWRRGLPNHGGLCGTDVRGPYGPESQVQGAPSEFGLHASLCCLSRSAVKELLWLARGCDMRTCVQRISPHRYELQ